MKLISQHLRESSSSEFKCSPRAFTRNGTLSPDLLLALLLTLIGDGARRGYQLLLDKFWAEAEDHGIALPTEAPVSAAAFCRARQRLKPEAIRSLLHRVVAAFEQTHGGRHRFKGRRVFGVDGAKINTQRAPALKEAFGVQRGAHCPQILVSTLFDVVAKVPHDTVVGSFRDSERDHLRELLKRVNPGDIVVLDRGYPESNLIESLLEAKIDFVMRVSTRSGFKAIETFLASGGDDYRILLRSEPGAQSRGLRPIEVRAVRRTGKDGEDHVYITSLRRSEFTRGEVCQLYKMRWEVELFYRLEKGPYLGHDQFHARTPDGVRQEVYAMMLYVALSRHLMAAAAEINQVPYDHLSQKGAMLAASEALTRLLLAQDECDATKHLTRLLDRIARRRERPRPNRSFPRRSFKPRPRWTPTGRTGTRASGDEG